MKESKIKFRKILEGKNSILYSLYFFFFILTVFVSNNSFFWDTVQLASKHAQFYFENNLTLRLLPDIIDSGHIPSFGYLLALFWKIFGTSLTVSHFMMLPFLIGIVYQANNLTNYFLSKKSKYLALILILADPTLLAQATLITPDIPLVFFYLMLLNGIFYDRKLLKLLAVVGLGLISMRGWMFAFILFLFDIISNTQIKEIRVNIILKKLEPYLPGGIIAIFYLVIHYLAKGWVGYHTDSPWAGSFEKVNFAGFIYNMGIYVWRLIDFGRVILWLVLLFLLFTTFKSCKNDPKFKKLLTLLFLLLAILPISMLLHKGLLQHRYLLPIYLTTALLTAYLIGQRQFKILPIPIIFSLLLGNLLVYPDKIAQGWDASLAYLPYIRLRTTAMEYMEEKHIPLEKTASFFPNDVSINDVDLNKDSRSFQKFNGNNEYVFYSNVYNISDEQFEILENQYNPIYTFEKNRIKIVLYKTLTP